MIRCQRIVVRIRPNSTRRHNIIGILCRHLSTTTPPSHHNTPGDVDDDGGGDGDDDERPRRRFHTPIDEGQRRRRPFVITRRRRRSAAAVQMHHRNGAHRLRQRLLAGEWMSEYEAWERWCVIWTYGQFDKRILGLAPPKRIRIHPYVKIWRFWSVQMREYQYRAIK